MNEDYLSQLRKEVSEYIIPGSVGIIFVINALLLIANESETQTATVISTIVFGLVSGIIAWRLVKNERSYYGGLVFVWSNIGILAFNLYQTSVFNGVFIFLSGYLVLVSCIMIAPRAGFEFWVLTLLAFGGAIYLREQELGIMITTLISPLLVNFMLALVGYQISSDWGDTLDSTMKAQLKAQSQRDMLFNTQDELESQRLARERLYNQLTTSVAVGQEVVSVLDTTHLMQLVSVLIQEKLGFARVGIFLADEAQEDDGPTRYVLAAQKAYEGYDELDQSAANGIVISANDSSIVSEAIAQKRTLVVRDIRDEQYKRHPFHLGVSRSEASFPLILRDSVFGVLNIQHLEADAFPTEVRDILQSLANQITIAVANASLFDEAREARQQAETANEYKTKFLANMSHELRTPLNAILNFTGFVSDGMLGPVNDDQLEALEKSLDSAEHLLSLINDVLDLTKIEAGAVNLFMEEVEIQNLLLNAMATTNALVKDRPIILASDLQPNLPIILGDKRRLRQVLLNLMSNAVKYTEQGQVTVAARAAEEHIIISVSDTGVGIAEEDFPRVFETFGQAKHNLENVVSTGLGLPITKQFIELHGGEIWFESQVGVGSTFHVRLPLKPPNEEEFVQLETAEGLKLGV